jgi:hypothetical protein
VERKHTTILVCAGIALLHWIIVEAQVGGPTTIGIRELEQREVGLGWSAKRQLLGKPVFNDKSERIGTIDDIVIAPDMVRAYAIVSVGDFLGVSRRDVVIRLDQLVRQPDGKFALAGATKDALKALPPFENAR